MAVGLTLKITGYFGSEKALLSYNGRRNAANRLRPCNTFYKAFWEAIYHQRVGCCGTDDGEDGIPCGGAGITSAPGGEAGGGS